MSAPLSHMKEENQHKDGDDDYRYVKLCQEGDTEAFEPLVRRHQKKMFNIAYRMTGSYDDALEVVQESFLSAYRMIVKFRGEAKFSTWLYGIVVNHARNRIRQTQNRLRHEVVSLDDAPAGKESAISCPPSTGSVAPVDGLIKKETQAKVQDCICGLDAEHREVIVLRDIQGFSYNDIARMLNINDGTVKSRLSRARNALKESLKKVSGGL